MLDRLFKGYTARAVPDFAPHPEELGTNLWVLDRRVAFVTGAQLPTRSPIVRLKDGSLVIISAPPNLDANRAAELEALGEVRALVAPSTFHYVFMHDCERLFPSATVYAAPGLRQRINGFEDAQPLDGATPWPGELELVVLRASRSRSEVLFFHVPSGSLIVTDLVFNLPPFERRADKLFARVAGIPAGFGPARTSRIMLLRDREAVAGCLAAVLSWPIDQIVVAHGDVLRDDPKQALKQALVDFT